MAWNLPYYWFKEQLSYGIFANSLLGTGFHRFLFLFGIWNPIVSIHPNQAHFQGKIPTT